MRQLPLGVSLRRAGRRQGERFVAECDQAQLAGAAAGQKLLGRLLGFAQRPTGHRIGVVDGEHHRLRRAELPRLDVSGRAAVLDEDGKEVWSASKLGAKEEGGTVVIVLPVASTLLPAGDYQAKLSGVPASGEPEAVGSYPFRVTRE